jgi:antitoxin component of MazEF toxin-antitoxin module
MYILNLHGGKMTSAVIAMWGNSHALRLPSKMVKALDLSCNDKVYLEAVKTGDEEKIIITKTPAPKKGTLEYLFKDYSGESFKTTLVNPIKPVGKEQW